MKELIEFVETWETSKKAEDLLAKEIALPSTEDIKNYIASLPSDEQAKLQSSIHEALQALAAHVEYMQQEMTNLQDQIVQNKQTLDANLAYMNTNKKPR